MSWEDILKRNQLISPKVTMRVNPKITNKHCCNKYSDKVQEWLNKWTIPEYWAHLQDDHNCEEVYVILHNTLLPSARENHTSFGGNLITGSNPPLNSKYFKEDHPQLKEAIKELEDIKRDWDKECNTKEYKKYNYPREY